MIVNEHITQLDERLRKPCEALFTRTTETKAGVDTKVPRYCRHFSWRSLDGRGVTPLLAEEHRGQPLTLQMKSEN